MTANATAVSSGDPSGDDTGSLESMVRMVGAEFIGQGLTAKDHIRMVARYHYLEGELTAEDAWVGINDAMDRPTPVGDQGNGANKGRSSTVPGQKTADGGQQSVAKTGQKTCASTRQSKPDGANVDLPKGHTRSAPSGSKGPNRARLEATRRLGNAVGAVSMGWVVEGKTSEGTNYTTFRHCDIDGAAKRKLKTSVREIRDLVFFRLVKEATKRYLGQPDPNGYWINDLPPEAIAEISRQTQPEMIEKNYKRWLETFAESEQGRLEGGLSDDG